MTGAQAGSLGILDNPARYLFFTGKGGVGKTTIACAVALTLAARGKSVLLVSTDPASNLDEMLGTALGNAPRPVPGAANLSAMNIDPEAAAEEYRARVLAQMDSEAGPTELATVREQLSGACTTEIAAFDQFVGLLADDAAGFDHVVFDTAPTGHTLRLLSLPKAWTGFLAGNDRGASCLGPHSGLKMQEGRFRAALATLGDPAVTAIVLVARADPGALREAARTSAELRALDLVNQRLVVNGVFRATDPEDPVARAMERQGERCLTGLPAELRGLPQDRIPLRSFDMVGLDALRQLLDDERITAVAPEPVAENAPLPGLDRLIDDLAQAGRGLIMVMGKGGVGKTTVAAAIAVGLVRRGHGVHLSTTDPAAHLAGTLDGAMPGLKVDRIDPKAETERYVAKVMASRAPGLDAAGQALLREDLASPCTEEVAVFHAFSRIVAEARSAFVVLDTAPTGHTLLLMDATGAYHRQMKHNLAGAQGRVITPLMRLQDPAYAKIVLVALPEVTPVSEASALAGDLRRAGIEPYGWVINRSLTGSGTRDPLLRRRLKGEQIQIDRVRRGLAHRVFLLPWQSEPPVGLAMLGRIAEGSPAAA